MSCPNANVLGVPGEGFHAARLGPVALNDTVGTIVFALLTSWFFKQSFWLHLLAWFVSAEVLHYWFGVPTAFLKMVHVDPSCPRT
jgi:hypothetical protein